MSSILNYCVNELIFVIFNILYIHFLKRLAKTSQIVLKSRGLFTCQVYSVELIVSQFLNLQVRQLETENMKMKRKKILLEEYNNTDITKGDSKKS